jgi:hypothetical protein
MTTEWNHLPNARLIDQLLTDLKQHPDLIMNEFEIWNTAIEAAWRAAWDEVWDSSRYAAWEAAQNATWVAAQNTTWGMASDRARCAIAALIAWDDAAKWLSCDADRLQVWVALSEDSAAILLLPYVRIREQIKQLEMV